MISPASDHIAYQVVIRPYIKIRLYSGFGNLVPCVTLKRRKGTRDFVYVSVYSRTLQNFMHTRAASETRAISVDACYGVISWLCESHSLKSSFHSSGIGIAYSRTMLIVSWDIVFSSNHFHTLCPTHSLILLLYSHYRTLQSRSSTLLFVNTSIVIFLPIRYIKITNVIPTKILWQWVSAISRPMPSLPDCSVSSFDILSSLQCQSLANVCFARLQYIVRSQ